MKREHLEHIIRAAAGVADETQLIIIGSQAILAQFPDAPEELLVSIEADVIPVKDPKKWDLIDGALGEESSFHETFGYYAQGVELKTAILPEGWRDRLISLKNINTGGYEGLCLEIHDLCISKYIANREKDNIFIKTAISNGLIHESILLDRIEAVAVDVKEKDIIRQKIKRDFG